MISIQLSRRALLAGATTTMLLTGCGTQDAAATDAADHARLQQARDLSQRMLDDLDAHGTHRKTIDALRNLHIQHVGQFDQAASLAPATPAMPPAALTLAAVINRERSLVKGLQAIALEADNGDIAALIASAAAGIGQELKRVNP